MAQGWNERGIGFKMPNKGFTKEEGGEGEDHHVVSMEIFADNVTLLASGYEEMQTMINEITVCMHRIKLKWKPGKDKEGNAVGASCLVAGSLRKTDARQEVVMETSKGPRALVYVD